MKTKKQVQILLLITMAAAVPTALAETPAGEKPKTEGKVAAKPGTLTAMIEDSVTFSTLAKALKAAELDVTLGAKGEFTIFAPTDDAFGKLPPEVLTKLLLPENKEKLRSLLLYHVVAGKVLAADLKDGDVKTMNGEKVKIDVESDKIEVDGSKVFSSDVMATNGVMHTIGEVLVPEPLKEFIAALAK
jgi:uncharacterized surface protein with fasciclin (FAS1) repeats